MKDVLPLNTTGNLIIRRSHVVVPKTLQRRAVELAREGLKGFYNQVAATKEGLVSEHRQAGREHGNKGKDEQISRQ